MRQPLVATLKAAMASFDRGQMGAGINQLKALQNKVDAQMVPSHPDMAKTIVGTAQRIIDVCFRP